MKQPARISLASFRIWGLKCSPNQVRAARGREREIRFFLRLFVQLFRLLSQSIRILGDIRIRIRIRIRIPSFPLRGVEISSLPTEFVSTRRDKFAHLLEPKSRHSISLWAEILSPNSRFSSLRTMENTQKCLKTGDKIKRKKTHTSNPPESQ